MVKIDVIGGFLGAGKTTLINKLIKEGLCGEKTVLLENEFGDVNVDSDLIENAAIQIKELTSGCICCTLQGDFVRGICEIAEEIQPDRILIEPTGAANLEDIVKACHKAEQKADVEVNLVLTVVNAECMVPLLEVGGEFFQKQIRDAGYIILSCVQNCSDEELAEVKERIRELNPYAYIDDRNWEEADGMMMLQMAEELGAADDGKDEEEAEESRDSYPMIRVERKKHRVHRGEFESAAYFPETDYTEEEILALLREFQEQGYGLIFRAKGFLKISGTIRRVEFVYGKYEIEEISYGGTPKFVVIGKNLKKKKLNDFFKEDV